MSNDKGRSISEAKPSFAVEIYGLSETPFAGDSFNVVSSDKQARDITNYRIKKAKNNKATESQTSLEELFKKLQMMDHLKNYLLLLKLIPMVLLKQLLIV